MTTASLFRPTSTDTQAPAPADEPQMAMVAVTPAIAEGWLEANTRNRQLRPQLVEQYARDMSAGRWTVNYEPVQVSRTGVLLNGQHRLSAIVESGTTQHLLVVTGLADEAQDTIDVGAKRNVAQQLGFRGIERGSTMAAVARIGMQVRHGRAYTPTAPELTALVVNDELLQWVVRDVLPTLPRITQPAVLSYCYLRFHHIDPAAAKEFFEHLRTLSDLPEGSPILALHKRFTLGERIPTTTKGRLFAVACVFQAWNAWREGETRVMIRPRARKDGDYNMPEPV